MQRPIAVAAPAPRCYSTAITLIPNVKGRLVKQLVTALAATLSLATTAHAQSKQERAVLVSYLESHDCRSTQSDLRGAFYDAGLESERARAVTLLLVASGDIQLVKGGNLTILQTGPKCRGTRFKTDPYDPEIVAALVQAYEQNACVLEIESPPLMAVVERFSDKTFYAAMLHLLNSRQVKMSGTYGEVSTFSGSDICKG